MAIFAVIYQPSETVDKLTLAISNSYPDSYIKVLDGAWLVAQAGSAQDVASKLGIADGSNGAALVLEVASYHGRANPNIWTWIKAKWEATSGAAKGA
jgi:hypothetical protein